MATNGRAQIYAAGRRPVLRNQIVTGNSNRDQALRALAREDFRGRFAQLRDRGEFGRGGRGRLVSGYVLGWLGPVFWPYADYDVIDYTIWPYGDDTFWPYAYDDLYDGIFGGYAPDAGASAGGTAPSGIASRARAAGGAEVCSGQASGLTDWPIERITEQVQPNQAQRAALDDLRDATAKAVDLLQSACPTDLPSTPTGRLTAMRQRVQTMLDAVRIVRPALDKFYGLLSDEQKERFNSLDTAGASGQQQPGLTQLCGAQATPFAGLPMDRIERALQVDDTQRQALEALDDAAKNASALLRTNCPQGQTLTPTGRVAAIEQRLEATLQALDTIRPALEKFYGSLSDEQRARFDRLPRTT